ncbi:MAG: hypothetical protein AB7S26_10015 [Sandaracinaceae bacterium]
MPSSSHRASFALILFLVACDGTAPSDAGPHPFDAATTLDAGHDAGAPVDAGGECLVVESLGDFQLDLADDTGLRARARITPDVGGATFDLYLWFQRFGLAEFTGEVALGTDPNATFPDCAHCVVALRGSDFDRGYFASEGTMQLDRSPFSGRLVLTLDGVVLREMVVEPSDDPIPFLQSRFIEGGRCLQLPSTVVSAPLPPSTWRCDRELYADGEGCDCACGAWDVDCDACDPFFDPSCDPTVQIPTRRCGASDVCLFELERNEGVCAATCDASSPCVAGFCADWPSGERVCVTQPTYRSDAGIGEVCPEGPGLRYCAIDNDVAGGVCAEHWSGIDGVDSVVACRTACATHADCIGDDECVALGAPGPDGGPGYCLPPYPASWTCGLAAWTDTECDCACGTWDPACGDPFFDAPMPSSRCAPSEVCVPESAGVYGSPGVCTPTSA